MGVGWGGRNTGEGLGRGEEGGESFSQNVTHEKRINKKL